MLRALGDRLLEGGEPAADGISCRHFQVTLPKGGRGLRRDPEDTLLLRNAPALGFRTRWLGAERAASGMGRERREPGIDGGKDHYSGRDRQQQGGNPLAREIEVSVPGIHTLAFPASFRPTLGPALVLQIPCQTGIC